MKFHSWRAQVLAVMATGASTVALAQAVAPPPLPPGAAQVRVEGGMNQDERKRQVRAHHHKFQHKKDYTRDDSVYGHESEADKKDKKDKDEKKEGKQK